MASAGAVQREDEACGVMESGPAAPSEGVSAGGAVLPPGPLTTQRPPQLSVDKGFILGLAVTVLFSHVRPRSQSARTLGQKGRNTRRTGSRRPPLLHTFGGDIWGREVSAACECRAV